MLFFFTNAAQAEPKRGEGYQTDSKMDEFRDWGLDSRWILIDDEWNICFFYLRSFVTCTTNNNDDDEIINEQD